MTEMNPNNGNEIMFQLHFKSEHKQNEIKSNGTSANLIESFLI